MAKWTAGLICIFLAGGGMAHASSRLVSTSAPIRLPALIQAQDQQDQPPDGLSGPDQSQACTAAGGMGSDTDCRRNGVQIDPNSGEALSPDDQCTSVGGTTDGEGCFRDGTPIDPATGDELQQGDPGYMPQPGDGQDQTEAPPDQDQSDQEQMAPPDADSGSGAEDSPPPDTDNEPPPPSDNSD